MPASVLIPAAVGAASLTSNVLGNKARNKQQKEAADLDRERYDQRRSDRDRYLQYLSGQGPQTSTGSSTSTTYSDTAPYTTEEYSPLMGRVRGTLERRLAGPGSSLPPGYAERGAAAINRSHEGAAADTRNALARMNLGPGSIQAATLGGPTDRARAGQLADFQANTPLVARGLETEDLNLAQAVASVFGRGQRGTSRTNSSYSSTGPAPIAPMGAFVDDGGPSMGYETGRSGLGEGIGSLGSMLGMIFADQLDQNKVDRRKQPAGGPVPGATGRDPRTATPSWLFNSQGQLPFTGNYSY